MDTKFKTVCAGRATRRNQEVFHIAHTDKTECGLPWMDRGWLVIDSDSDLDIVASSPFACAKCVAALHAPAHDPLSSAPPIA